MNSKIQLLHVEYMPKSIDKGILYVSRRFGVTAHKCPCGCGTKVILPLGPCEWSIAERNGKPTLHPSVGNWQIPCKSHYWIKNGQIEWLDSWSDEQIEAGRAKEQTRRELYYKNKFLQRGSVWTRLKNWILNLSYVLISICHCIDPL